MTKGDAIYINSHKFEFVEHPLYHVAHPSETNDDEFYCIGLCYSCAWAISPDNERVLLWLVGVDEENWAISRANPNYQELRAKFHSLDS